MSLVERRSRWILAMIRGGGLLVMFFIALAGIPASLCADGDCVNYRVGCLSDVNVCINTEVECGEAAGEECTDQGETYCAAGAVWNCPGELPYALVCGFDGGGGGID